MIKGLGLKIIGKEKKDQNYKGLNKIIKKKK